MGIVAGVDGGAGPAGFFPLAPRCQHVAYLAVEVREGWQSVKDQVPDPLDGVPKPNGNIKRRKEEQENTIACKKEILFSAFCLHIVIKC